MILSEPSLSDSTCPGRRHCKKGALVLPTQQDCDNCYPTLQDCRCILHSGTKKYSSTSLDPITSLCHLYFFRSSAGRLLHRLYDYRTEEYLRCQRCMRLAGDWMYHPRYTRANASSCTVGF